MAKGKRWWDPKCGKDAGNKTAMVDLAHDLFAGIGQGGVSGVSRPEFPRDKCGGTLFGGCFPRFEKVGEGQCQSSAHVKGCLP